MCNKEYNGYTNYETWVTMLWIDNDPSSQEESVNTVRESLRRNTYRYQTDEDFKEWVEEWFNLETTGLQADLINAALSEVNWKELTNLIIEDNDLDEDEDESEDDEQDE